MGMKNKSVANKQSYTLIWLLAFAIVISVMNSTMFNVALPELKKEFGLTSTQVSWVVTAYIIIYAVGSVTYGKLADMFKLKNLITLGLCFFVCGSVIGLVSDTYWLIIVSRILQSAGASVIPACSMLIPIRYVSEANRGRALGITSAGMALGTAIGPIIAGFILGFSSWRFLFAISIVILLAIPFFRRLLGDEMHRQGGKADFPGGILLAASVALLLLSITTLSLLTFALMISVSILFWFRVKTTNSPFVSPALFKNTRFTTGLIIGSLALTLNLCIPYLIPQMLTILHHTSPLQIGLIMSPSALIAAVFGLVGGGIADRKGSRYLFVLGGGMQLLSYLMLWLFLNVSPTPIIFILIVVNTGLTFAQIALANTVSRTLPREQAGVGMGIYMMCSFIAGAIGTSLLGKMLDVMGSNHAVFKNMFVIFSIWITVSAVLFIIKNPDRHSLKVNSSQ